MISALPVLGMSSPANGGYQIAGLIMTPTDFGRGYLSVEGGVIRDVVLSGSIPATAIDLHDRILCPSFIDLHNHIVYGVYPRWRPTKPLAGRFDWRCKTRCKVTVNAIPVDPYYRDVIAPAHKDLTGNGGDLRMLSKMATYGQIRALVGGSTTAVIDADLDPDTASGFATPGFVRDSDEWKTRVYGVLDATCVPMATTREVQSGRITPGAAEIVAELEVGKAALLIHVGEGSDAFSVNEFEAVTDRKLLTRNTALIHAMALSPTNWDAVKAARATLVFSPVSNNTLYGKTLKLDEVVSRKIRVVLSPDWTITGSSSLLDELRYAAATFTQLDAEQWLRACTESPADFLRLRLGRVEPGAMADLLAIAPTVAVRSRAEAAKQIVQAMPEQIELAITNGEAIYGTEPNLASLPSTRLATELFDVPRFGGTFPRAIRIAPDPILADLVRSLSTAVGQRSIALAPWWE